MQNTPCVIGHAAKSILECGILELGRYRVAVESRQRVQVNGEAACRGRRRRSVLYKLRIVAFASGVRGVSGIVVVLVICRWRQVVVLLVGCGCGGRGSLADEGGRRGEEVGDAEEEEDDEEERQGEMLTARHLDQRDGGAEARSRCRADVGGGEEAQRCDQFPASYAVNSWRHKGHRCPDRRLQRHCGACQRRPTRSYDSPLQK